MKNKPTGREKGLFHEDRRMVRCSVCHFKTELFYSWSDYDTETKHVEQREIECSNCKQSVIAQAVWE
jgi:hypothetical protein